MPEKPNDDGPVERRRREYREAIDEANAVSRVIDQEEEVVPCR